MNFIVNNWTKVTCCEFFSWSMFFFIKVLYQIKMKCPALNKSTSPIILSPLSWTTNRKLVTLMLTWINVACYNKCSLSRMIEMFSYFITDMSRNILPIYKTSWMTFTAIKKYVVLGCCKHCYIHFSGLVPVNILKRNSN